MQRVVILGCAGAGKTTFARRLGARLAAPVICLDAIWRRDWGPADVPGFRELMAQAHAGERWISDGNFAQATFDIRQPRADLVVWLELPKPVCAWRAVRRTFRPGEAHRIGDIVKVLKFVWGFDRINRPRIEALRREHGGHAAVVRLASDGEVARFLAAAG